MTTATAPPPLMAPVRTGLLGRRKLKSGSPPPPQPPDRTGLSPGGKSRPKCDECYSADAVYEIAIDMSLAQYLYMCAHHTKKHWAEFIARHYVIRKL